MDNARTKIVPHPVRSIAPLAVIAIAVAASTPIARASVIIDHFNGPTLDPAWTVVGNAGSFATNPGSYTVSTVYGEGAGLTRTLGSGDSEVMIQYGSITGLAGGNARLDVSDGPGQLIVIMAEAPRNGGWGPNIVIDFNNGTGPNQRVMSVPISMTITDLAFRMVWSESAQTFVVSYNLNNAGWSIGYTANYGIASSATRTVTPWILSWDAGPGTTTAQMNLYSQIVTAAVPGSGVAALASIGLAAAARRRRR